MASSLFLKDVTTVNANTVNIVLNAQWLKKLLLIKSLRCNKNHKDFQKRLSIKIFKDI